MFPFNTVIKITIAPPDNQYMLLGVNDFLLLDDNQQITL